ncbi:MAG: TetR/AcrR family transcriptional regulator [Hyphomicrobiales bacterium]|nr:TetR/AcrR family transcriptional regulator [Hyphomicrobiales bacterium]
MTSTLQPEAGTPLPPSDGRRDMIVQAARDCFARAGFHRATMRDVAQVAGMSPGNIYRYFPSKEAMVEGMCQQDKQVMRANFAKLRDGVDLFAVMAAVLRHHLVEEPRARFILLMEIWAEAARNPHLAHINAEVDAQVRAELRQFMVMLQDRHMVAPGLNVEFAITALLTFITGLFRRRALEANFDGEAELAMALSVCRAILQGAIAPDAATGPNSRNAAS